MNTETMITELLEREGGGTYTDNGADRGGPTRWGVTQATLALARGHAVTAADVRNLGEAEARAIYRKHYLEDTGVLKLESEHLRVIMFDCFVNHRPTVAVRLLQRACNVEDDGVLGPITIAAANAREGIVTALLVLAERFEFYGRLVSKELTDKDQDGIPDNAEFAWGWARRSAELDRWLIAEVAKELAA